MDKEKIRSHRDLETWKKSRELVKLIYNITEKFPQNEQFGITSQLRRAAVSVPTNIAEGFGRSHQRELVHFLTYSQGSLSEMDTLITLANDLLLIEDKMATDIMNRIKLLRVMLARLIQSIEKKHNFITP